jgi:hypothetical protein
MTVQFLMEVQAIARAHAVAMGGNAIVAFRVERSHFNETLKNQAYALVSISGDVVEVRRDSLNESTPVVAPELLVQHVWNANQKPAIPMASQ